VGQAVFVGFFVACAGINAKATVGYGRGRRQVNHAQPVGECVCEIIHTLCRAFVDAAKLNDRELSPPRPKKFQKKNNEIKQMSKMKLTL
jgi:hypothetical protein